MVPTFSATNRFNAFAAGSNRWLTSRSAFVVTVSLFVTALLLAGWASLAHSSANDRVVEQGWVRLSKARLDVLSAAAGLEADLSAGVAPGDALNAFATRRSAIDDTLSDLVRAAPQLRLAARSIHQTLNAIPIDPPPGEERIEIGLAQIAAETAVASSQSPLVGDLGFADRVASDAANLQLAEHLIDRQAGDRSDGAKDSFAFALAVKLARGGENELWRFGQLSLSTAVPAGMQSKLAALTTSPEAHTVQDAAAWAAAASGLDIDVSAINQPDVAAVNEATASLSSELMTMGGTVVFRQATQLSSAEGSGRALTVRLFWAVVGCLGIAWVMLISRRRRLRINDDELRAAASTDRLTGLGNRVHLDVEVALLVERSPEVVLMHIDLDHFKPVNDTYGHAVGDRVLQLSAERLRDLAGEHDGIAARLGGDEFVLVLPSVEPMVVDEVTQSLLGSLQSFQIGGLDLAVGASIGVARGTGGVTDLLLNADLALYQAKRTGRGQASTFRAEAAAFVSFVREALTEGRVQVVYQPQVSLRDGRCVGAEVLARLVDSNGSLIPAKDWLGIAEWLGVTGELFEHVVTAVREDLDNGPPLQTTLWLNVAPNDLIRPGGTDWVLSQLSRLELPVSMIGLELTETEAITDSARLAVVLERLKSVGLGLALDDFGARNTPIGHLVDLPVTRVKLDASLIAGIGDDMPPSSWVVRAMAELAKRLQIEVMAEGVTSGHQVSLLAKLGVPVAQGYLLGLPGPIDRLPGAVDIPSLLHTSLNGFDSASPVGPLVQMNGNRSAVATGRPHVARSEVGDRRRDFR